MGPPQWAQDAPLSARARCTRRTTAHTGTATRDRRARLCWSRARRTGAISAGPNDVSPAERCRARFLRFFPGGFRDPTYLDWERNYKADAHERWNGDLDEPVVRQLIKARQYSEIVTRAIRIEARTNLLFSFEK